MQALCQEHDSEGSLRCALSGRPLLHGWMYASWRPWDVVGSLCGLCSRLSCEVRVSDRVVTLCSIGSTEYGYTAETKPSVDRLRIACDVFRKNRDIAHFLIWFLLHLDLRELDLSCCRMDKNDIDGLSQAFSSARDLELEAMDICHCSMAPESLGGILPHLKDSVTVAWLLRVSVESSHISRTLSLN
jgi:hypothetical protein